MTPRELAEVALDQEQEIAYWKRLADINGLMAIGSTLGAFVLVAAYVLGWRP